MECKKPVPTTWESVEHDWMVNNIDQLDAALQQYVKTFYHATYDGVDSDLASYADLMYMGLQNCTIYQEDVTSEGLLVTCQAN
jgi:hypothetical protein